MKIINSFLSETEDMLSLNVQKNKVVVIAKDFVLSTALIAGSYIKYEKIVDINYSQQVIINNNELKKALDFVCPISSLNKNDMIEIIFEDTQMSIKAKNEMADCNTVVPIIKTLGNGKDFKFYVKCSYLEEVCRVISSDSITINVEKPETPIIIKEGTSVFMVLPMRNR